MAFDLADLEANLNDDPVLLALPELGPCTILFSVDDARFVLQTGSNITVREAAGIDDSWDFSFTISPDAWKRASAQRPPPGYNTAQALVANIGPEIVGGDRRKWAQYAPVVERVLDSLRGPRDAGEGPMLPRESQTVGRYVTVDVDGLSYRIFYESAGEGVPLLCLHTAGSDARQYRFLLEDREVTSEFEVIAFDLPWHGRSSPPSGWRSMRYELRTEWYAAVILAFCEALDLDAPVLMGCSMGGAIGLYLSSVHGSSFRGVCAVEGALEVPGRRVRWTRHTEVDHSVFLSTWVDGLMSPNSPRELRDQVLWEYVQSGPGVYNGDTYFLTTDPVLRQLKPATCPLYVFSGEYDYSSTPEASRRAADQLGGEFIYMESKGHFPMSEDPVSFKRHLMPVLHNILANGASAG